MSTVTRLHSFPCASILVTRHALGVFTKTNEEACKFADAEFNDPYNHKHLHAAWAAIQKQRVRRIRHAAAKDPLLKMTTGEVFRLSGVAESTMMKRRRAEV
ncbi:uncharacterized protein BDZ99DRAFT_457842 [Mytilinidion resinicola]|uniref:Uncharacterized protein n=1 Tax=Mytilinidion resinicola TaxID=574789 RepID=A0A6A6Z4Z6_9PEZI|nr:uncharacterized protein BDZ99DRAFT_457842 [Mytilinidion resinicola]KAF2815898.1 hypothetical protein BDZ99DRAFT_457842 [Mytilinidion resinicola]